jgi:hypothetical protein
MMNCNFFTINITEPILLQHNPLFGLTIVESDHKGIEHPLTMNQTMKFDDDTTKEDEELDKDNNKDKDKFENQDKVIRPWEELQFKRNKFGLGYEKNEFDFFHILDYSKPVTFVSTGFLCDDLQQHTMDDGKKELDVDDVEDDDDDDVDDAG